MPGTPNWSGIRKSGVSSSATRAGPTTCTTNAARVTRPRCSSRKVAASPRKPKQPVSPTREVMLESRPLQRRRLRHPTAKVSRSTTDSRPKMACPTSRGLHRETGLSIPARTSTVSMADCAAIRTALDKTPHVVVRGARQNLVGRTFLHALAVAQNRDAGADPQRFVKIVRDTYDGLL